MADAEALPATLRELFGLQKLNHAIRPGRARSERTAKDRLRMWVEGLLGEPVLQGGVEYAAEVGRVIEPARIGASRNPDFRGFLTDLAPFLERCAERA